MSETTDPVIRHLLTGCDDDYGERVVTAVRQKGLLLSLDLLRVPPETSRPRRDSAVCAGPIKADGKDEWDAILNRPRSSGKKPLA